jgi:hypothetical protein
MARCNAAGAASADVAVAAERGANKKAEYLIAVALVSSIWQAALPSPGAGQMNA